jgi:hypothetical protein
LTLPQTLGTRRIDVSFDGPDTSSDGGWLLLQRVDEDEGLTKAFAALLPDERDPSKVQHTRLEQVRQRAYQIALGYEDCNDADTLRHDPLLKAMCSRMPDDAKGLSSQPTLSRFENAMGMRTVKKLLTALEASYVAGLPSDTELVILDPDTTDVETHGNQQLTFFHGHYDHYMYHPVMIYDGLSGQLITAILQPGNVSAARGAKPVICRLIRLIKARFPSAQIVVRGDSGFCVPRMTEALEQLDAELGDIYYVLGMAKNKALLRKAESLMEEAERRFNHSHRQVRLVGEFQYAAKKWPRARRTIVKAEHSAKGANPRFVITNIDGFVPELLYNAYCERGQCENYIKDFKCALFADRLSCSSFAANFFRLLLHMLVFRLMHALRNRVAEVAPALGRCQFDTLRVRLLKVAVTVRQSVRRIWMRLPAAFSMGGVFRDVLAVGLSP